MSKVGRNDPCPCGSGQKYKNCCIGKEFSETNESDNNDLFKISCYGSEVYEKAELDKFSRFFIETTAGEKFEIRKAAQGYMIRDIVPPENRMTAINYRTIEFNDIQRQKLLKHNSEYDYMDIGTHNYFGGVVEGGNFTWERSDGFTSTKGKISKLFIRQALGNYILNVSLFPPKAEYRSVDDFLQSGFSIYTQTDKLDFTSKDGKLFLEGDQVFAVLSLYEKDSLSIDEMFSQSPREYNVCFDIVIGKPIFILKIQGEGLKVSIINEQVTDIKGLQG